MNHPSTNYKIIILLVSLLAPEVVLFTPKWSFLPRTIWEARGFHRCHTQADEQWPQSLA